MDGEEKVLHRASFGICVEEKHWGNGIGKILTHNSILLAFELGYEQIELGVFSDNHRAKKCIMSLGFKNGEEFRKLIA